MHVYPIVLFYITYIFLLHETKKDIIYLTAVREAFET